MGSKWSDKVYWQVTDSPAKGHPNRWISSRSTQLGKEDFYVVVIVPKRCNDDREGWTVQLTSPTLNDDKDDPISIWNCSNGKLPWVFRALVIDGWKWIMDEGGSADGGK